MDKLKNLINTYSLDIINFPYEISPNVDNSIFVSAYKTFKYIFFYNDYDLIYNLSKLLSECNIPFILEGENCEDYIFYIDENCDIIEEHDLEWWQNQDKCYSRFNIDQNKINKFYLMENI